MIDPKGNKTDLYAMVKKLNARIKALGPTLMKLDTVDVYHSGVVPEETRKLPDDYFFKPLSPDDALLISRMVDREDGRNYLMVVNKDNRSLKKRTVKLQLDGAKTVRFRVHGDITGLALISHDTGQGIPMKRNLENGVFSDSLLPGEGHLFLLPDGNWDRP